MEILNRTLFIFAVSICMLTNAHATAVSPLAETPHTWLYDQPGFFRFTFDNLRMPHHMQDMGLLSLNYFADFTPNIYGGVGVYGAVTGNQGGLFVLGLGGGFHHRIVGNWLGDIGLFVGGGGGRSSLVGGGLMLKPYVGLAYDFKWFRLGVHYSYIDFPSGEVRSSQVGADLDIPFDFYYINYDDVGKCFFDTDNIRLCNGKFLSFQRNDFSLLVQGYVQKEGVKNVYGQLQDGTIHLVGAELDHFITENLFWFVKTAGAFGGISNGYMDILGGIGYHISLGRFFALVPQLGLGAGGGANVDTGGGIIVQPQLGVQIPLTSRFAIRVSGGYIKAVEGDFEGYTATGNLIYHLDVAQAASTPWINMYQYISSQTWRIHLFNQTYIHPQRSHHSKTSSPDNLFAIQFDQYLTPYFFFSYQAASAYAGQGAGGLASGMIGPGIQTCEFFRNHIQFFGQFLIGAAGGGSLALGGGAIIEPVIGLHYTFNPNVGIQASVSQIKSLRDRLNTPVFNIGFTFRFGTLNSYSKYLAV